MKKTITKILLTSIILLGFGNINQTNAGDLDGLEEIFNQQDEFSCIVIDREITHYPRYKGMIDNYFRKISTKSYAYRKNIYTKLDILTTRKLTTINKTRQERIYAIIGYIKCESNNELDDLISNNYKFKVENLIKKTDNGPENISNLYLLKNGKEILIQSIIVELGEFNDIRISGNYLIYNYKHYVYGNNDEYIYNIKKEKFENKKGTFIKYIGDGVEARQNSMYTYFYYNGKLVNTIKNKVNKDGRLIYGNNVFYSPNDYLSEYYAKKKLNLYSASLENNGKRIFFVKKIDNGKINFAYDLKKGKLEDWTFEY